MNSKPNNPETWVKEQEIQALKVQNRHLIQRIEELENSKSDIEVNNKLISNFQGQLDQQLTHALNQLQQQVQKFTRAVLTNTEAALKNGFESIQGTMKALYSQNQRGQEQIDRALQSTLRLEEKIENHQIDVLAQAKVQNLQFQDRLVGNIQNFCDRIERVVDQRLEGLSALDSLKGKQEESIKLLSNVDQHRSDLISKVMSLEITQKNTDSVSRETQNQVQALRLEVRSVRDEIQNLIQNIQNARTTTSNPLNDAAGDLATIQNQKNEAIKEKNEIEDYLRKINDQLNDSNTLQTR